MHKNTADFGEMESSGLANLKCYSICYSISVSLLSIKQVNKKPSSKTDEKQKKKRL